MAFANQLANFYVLKSFPCESIVFKEEQLNLPVFLPESVPGMNGLRMRKRCFVTDVLLSSRRLRDKKLSQAVLRCAWTIWSGSMYFVAFVCAASNFVLVRFLIRKNEVLNRCSESCTLLGDASIPRQVKVIRSDHGEEYSLKAWDSHCLSSRVHHEFTMAYNPHPNSAVESMNSSLAE